MALSVTVLLSSLLYAVVLVVSAAVFVLITPRRDEILSRLKGFAFIFIPAGLVTLYFFLPILLDRTYLNRTIWLEAWKYDSFGAGPASIFTDQLPGAFADAITNGGGLGLAAELYQAIKPASATSSTTAPDVPAPAQSGAASDSGAAA